MKDSLKIDLANTDHKHLIHNSGPFNCRIALGFWRAATWNYNDNELYSLIEFCIDKGLTTFDHADIYGAYRCEKIFGNFLRENPEIRPNIQLVTKCGIKELTYPGGNVSLKHYDSSEKHILNSVENSLDQLSTNYVDVLLLHRPDPLLNATEVASVFSTLKDSGKVLHFGVSNFSVDQFRLLQSRLEFPLITNQIEFSVMHPEPIFDGTLDQCQRLEITPMGWSPLGGGRIFEPGCDDKALRLNEILLKLAKFYGVTRSQIALAWILMHPSHVVPIIGTKDKGRIEDAMKSLELVITREHWFEVLRAYQGVDVP